MRVLCNVYNICNTYKGQRPGKYWKKAEKGEGGGGNESDEELISLVRM